MEAEVRFHRLLNTFAANSRTQLTEDMLAIFDLAVQPFGYERAAAALQFLMLQTKRWEMPTPAALVAEIEKKPTRIAQANEVAARVIESVTRFGYSNPKEAETYVGQVGWMVVRRFGGWSHLCEIMGLKLDVGQARAQMRDLALSIMELGELDQLEKPPELPGPKGESLSSAIKLLAKGKGIPK